MKRITTILIINLIFAVLQTAFFQILVGNLINPNLVFAIALALLLAGETDLAYVSALGGGVILDLLGSTIPGLSALYICAFIFLILFMKKIFLRGSISILLFALPAIYIYKLVIAQQMVFNYELILGTLITVIISFIFYTFYKYFKYEQPII